MFKHKYHPDYKNISWRYMLGEIEKYRARRMTKRQTTLIIRKLEKYVEDSARLKYDLDCLVDYIAKEKGNEFDRKKVFQELIKKKKIFDTTYENLESHGYLEGSLDYV